MKIHEYQAKELLKADGIPIQDGLVCDAPDQIDSLVDRAASVFNTNQFVIKAQIHAGGRGKGGGVVFCPSKEAAIEAAHRVLGMQLITHQTTSQGQPVQKIMIAEALDIDKEFYLAITLDRAKGCDVIMASTEGGVDIEDVAETAPHKIVKVWVDPLIGFQPYQARYLAFKLGLAGAHLRQSVALFTNFYACYKRSDAAIAEINPLVVTKTGELVALDAKFNFDSNALYRQPSIRDYRDLSEEDPTEVDADSYNLNYIKLDGNVGCMVNGAGLAMATMDIIQLKGGTPANFLDVGGGASVETVKNGFRIILSDPNVKAVLINIFGGIVRCDRVANGIIEAVKELDLRVPVVVRLEGTNADVAKQILAKADLTIIPATSLSDAAEKVVETVISGVQ